jgi:hypothetical protein
MTHDFRIFPRRPKVGSAALELVMAIAILLPFVCFSLVVTFFFVEQSEITVSVRTDNWNRRHNSAASEGTPFDFSREGLLAGSDEHSIGFLSSISQAFPKVKSNDYVNAGSWDYRVMKLNRSPNWSTSLSVARRSLPQKIEALGRFQPDAIAIGRLYTASISGSSKKLLTEELLPAFSEAAAIGNSEKMLNEVDEKRKAEARKRREVTLQELAKAKKELEALQQRKSQLESGIANIMTQIQELESELVDATDSRKMMIEDLIEELTNRLVAGREETEELNRLTSLVSTKIREWQNIRIFETPEFE